MISKILKGRTFVGVVTYICKDPKRAEILETEGVRANDYSAMAKDFLLQQQLLPSKTRACFHGVLSFYPGENLADQTMVEIAKKYLTQVGIVNTQFAITKHTDKAHLHLHIVANMVDNTGHAIKDSWIAKKGKQAAQNLTREYGLIPGLEKHIKLINGKTANPSTANKYKIYASIIQLLPKCKTLQILKNRLKKQGIETQYKYKADTKVKIGISFKIGNDCFQGGKIDRKFSFKNLAATLGKK